MKSFKDFVLEANDTPKGKSLNNSHGSHAKRSEKHPEAETKGKSLNNSHGSHAKRSEKYPETYSRSKSNIKESRQTDMFDSDQSHLGAEAYGKFLSHNDNSHIGDTPENQTEKFHELHPLNNPESDDVFNYTKHSKDLNDHLVHSHDSGRKPQEQVGSINIRGLDSNITRAKTRFHTYSGSSVGPSDLPAVGKSKAGNLVYAQPAYMSASHKKFVADGFARDNGRYNSRLDIWHFDTHEGEPTIFAGKHSNYDTEHETIHPRTDSTPERYHLEHIGTTTYINGEGKPVDVHHVRRIPASEIQPLDKK